MQLHAMYVHTTMSCFVALEASMQSTWVDIKNTNLMQAVSFVKDIVQSVS